MATAWLCLFMLLTLGVKSEVDEDNHVQSEDDQRNMNPAVERAALEEENIQSYAREEAQKREDVRLERLRVHKSHFERAVGEGETSHWIDRTAVMLFVGIPVGYVVYYGFCTHNGYKKWPRAK